MRKLARTVLTLAAAVALAALGAGGCGDSGAAPLALSWAFADGRSCEDAGAFTVVVQADGHVLGQFSCAQGLAPQAIMLPMVASSDVELGAVAESAQGDELYRGAQHVVALPPSLTITLYATFAR
jgi:hypothetical protein